MRRSISLMRSPHTSPGAIRLMDCVVPAMLAGRPSAAEITATGTL